MKIRFRPAPVVLALVVLIGLSLSGCASGARAGDAERLSFATPTAGSLPGGVIPAQPYAAPGAEQPTLPPLPTLVPTISLPTLAPLSSAEPALPMPTLAPPDTAAPEPTSANTLDAACLTGMWQVTDLQQAMAGSLAASGSTLLLERVDGRAVYVFGADGGMSLTYEQLTAALSGTVENRPVNVLQSLNGAATARYTVDPAAGVIEMSAFGGDGIRSSLSINGQTLAEGSLPVWLAFTRGQAQPGAEPTVVQSSRAAAACQGNTLILQALEPVPGPPLRLERVTE